jgi:hypothetical protein
MEFEKISDLFIEFIADCIAYITALVFFTFLLFPYSLFRWIFSLFKRFYTLVKEITYISPLFIIKTTLKIGLIILDKSYFIS